MKTQKTFLALACLAGCLCFANSSLYAKTPGEKVDKAIDSTKEKVKEVKEEAKEKYDKAKEKCDEAREKAAEKIKPS